MKNQKVGFIVCLLVLCVIPSLLYAQTSYEETLKQKLDDPLKVIEENKRLIGGKDDWVFYQGKWEVIGETIKYLGTDTSTNTEEQRYSGIALYKTQRLWNGYIEASITFSEEYLRNEKNAVFFMFSYNPITGDRYEIGFGGNYNNKKLAYDFFDNKFGENGNLEQEEIQYAGQWGDLLADFEYRIRIVIHERQADFIVNGVKVFGSKLPRNMYSDFIGISIRGTTPIDFKYVRIKAEDPFDLIRKRLEKPKK